METPVDEQLHGALADVERELGEAEATLQSLTGSADAGIAEIAQLLARLRGLYARRAELESGLGPPA